MSEKLTDFDAENVTCHACKFWNNHGINTGECRRNPPVIGPGFQGRKWPITKAIDWCGKGARRYSEELVAKYPELFLSKGPK